MCGCVVIELCTRHINFVVGAEDAVAEVPAPRKNAKRAKKTTRAQPKTRKYNLRKSSRRSRHISLEEDFTEAQKRLQAAEEARKNAKAETDAEEFETAEWTTGQVGYIQRFLEHR